MNFSLLKKQDLAKWLVMLLSLIAGLAFATAIDAQTLTSGSQTIYVDHQPGDFTPAGQLVVTNKSYCRKIPVCIAARDEVWLVSAREMHQCSEDLSQLQCARLQNGQWVCTDLDQLFGLHLADKSMVTMIYVHGNRTNLKWAKSRGLQVYQNALTKEPRPPVRYVIFAWKSEVQQARPISDYRIKSERSVALGNVFAKFLNGFEDRNMVLGGFSLGAQVILSAVTRHEMHDQRSGRFKIAIIAPALDTDFVNRGLIHVADCPIVDQTEVFRNTNDRAVSFSQLIIRRGTRSCVSTLTQLAESSQSSRNPIGINDITREVSKKHSIVDYCLSPSLNRKMAELVNAVFRTSTMTPIGSNVIDPLELVPQIVPVEINPAPGTSNATIGVSQD